MIANIANIISLWKPLLYQGFLHRSSYIGVDLNRKYKSFVNE